MSEITLTKDNFEKEVLQSKLPVLVDFWAAWCGPCKMVAPAIARLAENYIETLKVGKVNVDEESDLAYTYNISSIPTLLIFKEGKVVDQKIGAVSLSVLESFVAPHLKGSKTRAELGSPKLALPVGTTYQSSLELVSSDSSLRHIERVAVE